jgi:predicted TPR repeat methyltransferase
MTLIQPAEPAAKDTSMASYDSMAPHYEAFVGDAEVMRYPEWLAGLMALAAEHGATGGRALDVGCGTGRSLEALLTAGFDASGCDASARMMEIARARLGENVDLQVATLPEIPPGRPLHLVTAVNDILNYIAPRDLDAAISAMAGRLTSGGVLLFDANTPLTFESFFGRTFCRSVDGLFLVWESLGADTDDGGHRADLHAFTPDPTDPDRWTHSVSHHVQYHHPHAQVCAALTAAGLELCTVQGQHAGGDRDPNPDETVHSKRIYVARLP